MSWLDPLLAIKTQQAGTTAGTRQTINFSSGATVTDDPANDRVNVAITGSGITQLTGDVTAGPGSGSVAATVAKVNGVAVSGVPTAGQALVATSGTAASWSTVTPADASTSVKGIVQLAGDIAGTATSVTVAKVNGVSVSGTPTSGQVIRATSGTASSWASVARGDITNTSGATGDLITGDATTLGRLAIGSTGQVLTVSGGAPVWAAPSAGASVAVGPYASRPAATAGATYYPTDGWCHYVGDGTTWRPIIGGIAGTEPPAASTFTALNVTGSSSLTDANGALVALGYPGTGGNPDHRVWHAPLGSATNFEACIYPIPVLTGLGLGPVGGSAVGYPICGIGLRESSTGKMVNIMWMNRNGASNLTVETLTSPTGSRATIGPEQKIGSDRTQNLFLRLRISGANLVAEYSGGRGVFSNLETAALTSVFTTAPDQYCLICWPYQMTATGGSRIVVPHLATY